MRDFRVFWAGQTVSQLGSAFTLYALPLLVFRLTGSGTRLAVATAASFLPYLLLGLPLGAWVDRVDRKRAMVAADLGRAAAVATVPALAAAGALPLWWIYAVAFLATTLSIAFDAGQFAAVPALAGPVGLVSANARLLVGEQLAHVLGPLLAGALVAGGVSTAAVLWADAASFLVSAGSLALIRASFGGGAARASRSLLADVGEGLRCVLERPLLRDLTLLLALVNFTIATQWSQLVLFAEDALDASDGQVGVLYAAGSAGAVLLALVAAPLRRRLGGGALVLGALAAGGVVVVALALTPWLWLAVPLWALRTGLGQLLGVTTASLRQEAAPPQLLSRVGSVGQVAAWSAIPAGALLGGFAIDATGSVRAVYAGIGVVSILLAAGFARSAVGRG